jgi:hypothetical protein
VIAAADVIVPVSVAPPTLGLTLTTDALTFTWPASATGFALEQTDSLTPPIDWHPVTNAPVQVDGRQTLQLSQTNGTAFYRLRTTP